MSIKPHRHCRECGKVMMDDSMFNHPKLCPDCRKWELERVLKELGVSP